MKLSQKSHMVSRYFPIIDELIAKQFEEKCGYKVINARGLKQAINTADLIFGIGIYS